MAWYDYLFDSEWRQRADIKGLIERDRRRRRQQHRREAQRRRTVADLEERVAELESEQREMARYVKALTTYLVRHQGMDPHLFFALMDEIDAADGEADGGIGL